MRLPNHRYRLIQAILILCAYALLAPTQALACECMTVGQQTDPATWQPGLTDIYSAVFSGHVTSVESVLVPIRNTGTYRPMALVTFRVTASWKGPHAPVLWLLTGTGSGDCGYPFEVGYEYLVFGESFDKQDRIDLGLDEQTLTTGACGLTSSTKAGSKVIEYLDRTNQPWSPNFRTSGDAPPNPSLQRTNPG